MKTPPCATALVLLSFLFLPSAAAADQPSKSAPAGVILLQDDFQRDESDPKLEKIGNGWETNSLKRAAGNKQVDLVDGAMHITRHPVADHGVSVVHDVDFRDATIGLRFRLGAKDDLGINIADMQEKSVHAGHLCVARVRLNKVDLTDLKTGNMNLPIRSARQGGKLTPAQKKLIASKTRSFPLDLAADTWHQLTVQIDGDTMRMRINGQAIGQFSSPGIAHPTKRRLRLSVNRSAWVDDVKIWAPANG
jgi:hypothetical protein